MTKDISSLINVDITHPVKVKKQKDSGLTLSRFWVGMVPDIAIVKA